MYHPKIISKTFFRLFIAILNDMKVFNYEKAVLCQLRLEGGACESMPYYVTEQDSLLESSFGRDNLHFEQLLPTGSFPDLSGKSG